MEAPIPKIFVIVVTYKGKQWYDRCFTSLRNSTIPVQTIVVDNASNDGTVEYIKEHYPEIMLIESKENLGFGKGNNLALKYAYEHGCDYVFLLNQDAWLDKDDTLENLVNVAKDHLEYGILSPMHLYADKKAINMMYEYGGNFFSSQFLSDLYCGTLKDVYETNYVNATAWLLSRNTLSVLGGFDPLFFLYGEDDDYLNRARYHKVKIGINPSTIIIHDHRQEDTSEFCLSLFRKASRDSLSDLLDLNKPFEYHYLRRYYLRKYLRMMFVGDKAKKKYFMDKFAYIKRVRHDVDFSRRINSIKQPNWIQ